MHCGWRCSGGSSEGESGIGGHVSGGGAAGDLFSAGSHAVPTSLSAVLLSLDSCVFHECVDAFACVLVKEWMFVCGGCVHVYVYASLFAHVCVW